MNATTLSAGPAPARWWASIGAVLLGLFANAIPATLLDAMLHALQVFPPWDQPIGDLDAAIAISYRLALGVFGGYVVARFAPRHPAGHAWVLGGIGTVLGLAGLVAMKGFGPTWYPVALAVAALPLTLAGAVLHGRARERTNA